MKLIVLLYLFIGDATAGRFTGRITLIDRQNIAAVIFGNVIGAGLLVFGLRHAAKRGRFLGFDKWLWVIATVGCYAIGIALNVFFGGRG